MGFCTIAAVLDAIFRISKAAATLIAQCVQRAVAEQAVELPVLYSLVAGKVLTFSVLKKLILLHNSLLIPLSTDKLPMVHGKTPFFHRFGGE